MRRFGSAVFAVTVVLTVLPAIAVAETVEQRLERMEQEIRELRAELKRRDGKDTRRAPASRTKTAAPATTHAEPPPPAVAATPPETTAPPVATASKSESGTSRSGLSALVDRVTLGGYGSVRFEGSSLAEQKNTFTYRRFVLTTDANIAPSLRAYMELEFERFRKLEIEKATGKNTDGGLTAEQAIEATSNSEISIEQAWLQYDIVDQWMSMRVGGVLVPLGRFNLNHDDNRWDLPRRSLVDRGVPVLPSTAAWSELGVGFLGDLPLGENGQLSYQGYVVNGLSLDTEFEQILESRQGDTTLNEIEVEVSPSTGTFSNDPKNAKSITGRLAWSPILGHEIAASGYYGQYTPDFLGDEDLWAVSGDGRTGWGPFELEGEYVFTRYEGIRNVAKSLARTALNTETESEAGDVETEVEFELANLAQSKQGYWLEGRYRFWPTFLNDTFLGRPFSNPQLVAVLRGEQVWLHGLVDEATFSGGRLTAFEEDNRWVNRFSVGLAYRPVPLVVFQLAYEYTWTNPGQSLAGVTNFMPAGPTEDHANSILVGAAFGF